MMTEYLPESSPVWPSLGDTQRVADRRNDAVASYRRFLAFSRSSSRPGPSLSAVEFPVPPSTVL
jgi:hypothetical protein